MAVSSGGRTIANPSGAVGAVVGASGRPRRGVSRPPLAARAMRTELGIVAALLAAAGLAWWSTAERMAGMDAGPGTALGSVGWFTGVWATMMAAMMLPSLAPSGSRLCGGGPPRAQPGSAVRRRLSARLERRRHRRLRPVRARKEPVRRLAGLAQRRPLARGGRSRRRRALPADAAQARVPLRGAAAPCDSWTPRGRARGQERSRWVCATADGVSDARGR